jgi:hypothetical protein
MPQSDVKAKDRIFELINALLLGVPIKHGPVISVYEPGNQLIDKRNTEILCVCPKFS